MATANNSLLSLYIPTVVIYTFGSLINDDCAKSPSDPVTNDGLLEKLYSAFLTRTKKCVLVISSEFLAKNPYGSDVAGLVCSEEPDIE